MITALMQLKEFSLEMKLIFSDGKALNIYFSQVFLRNFQIIFCFMSKKLILSDRMVGTAGAD
jgi:hypothetical protein